MKEKIGEIAIMAAFLALLDQISKALIVKYLDAPYGIINGILQFEYAENTGMAFGISMPYPVLIVASVILLAILPYVWSKEFDVRRPMARITIALILGGALGNIIDRIINGYVVDFIAIWKWPNFNLADLFITIGILLTIIFYAKIKHDE
jgi:signal peptidase II